MVHELALATTSTMYSTWGGKLTGPYLSVARGEVKTVAFESMVAVVGLNGCQTVPEESLDAEELEQYSPPGWEGVLLLGGSFLGRVVKGNLK